MARPSDFTQETADAICGRISAGESLRAICQDDALPAKGTVFRWLAENEAFQDQYAHAREEQADFYAEQIIEIADEEITFVKRSKHGGKPDDDTDDNELEVAFDAAAVARNRLRVDARKWFASKVAPKKYGEKVAVGGSDDMPPIKQTVTIEFVSARPAT